MFELDEKIKKQGTAVGLGYFDGIHRGHQAVLGAALKKAAEHNLVPVDLSKVPSHCLFHLIHTRFFSNY